MVVDNSRKEKKYIKRWKKLGFDYYKVKELFSSIEECEKQLKKAIGICDKQTEDMKKENEKRKKTLEFLTSAQNIG